MCAKIEIKTRSRPLDVKYLNILIEYIIEYIQILLNIYKDYKNIHL